MGNTKIFLLTSIIFLCTGLNGRAQHKSVVLSNTLAVSLYGDRQSEDFRWSIAGNSAGRNPNILSEVSWKNVKTNGIGADVQLNICAGIFIKGNYHHSFIFAGTATDTDYAQDNRSAPTYNATLNSNEGSAFAYLTALGYEIIKQQRIKLKAYAGYTKNRQFLHLKEFNQQTNPDLKTLNSTYQTSWTGAMIGADTRFTLNRLLSATALLDYQQLNYNGHADWNLIDAFAHPVSFKHTAKGFAAEAVLSFDFQLSSVFAVSLRGTYSHAETGKGTDKLFLIDGQQQLSQFNGAKRTNKGVGLGITMNL